MRYFSELAYKGTNYHGWQRQLNAPSVQQAIEEALSTILGTTIAVTGCGRTDTGVHASQYFLHFDFEGKFPEEFLRRINKLLPSDVAIRSIYEVAADAHARFDAIRRSYEYHIVLDKNPFLTDTAWHFPFFEKLDWEKTQAAAALLLNYGEFQPFCKSNTDVHTMECTLFRSEWVLDKAARRMVFHVSANRFLRGMVRLIVGMTLNVGLGKVELSEVQDALERQVLLKKSWSVPAEGLFLTEVRY
ncbi:MAG: tRNA pseudouridine(38-40) synthase TruA [Saprospiraceae bacterium]|nr:tRNA pseudouridine(38-40) synthase TruA [Saprospiraceae bacterium]MCF8252263.1 tRNA pseudouridine(38-40) synthase TruA [Saprospiraceae bacterium]MCF8283092.1 tRNA pseudouridine(38-40) synthase TruA [Bacteroidales bacterium]MCF8313908.1 tRNA pseudouridine(38-40) synthase TruA [Saprospiraceae bacterium]MCF8443136.1 tRNA pseudouridine(38-40) synthase TruA [Saprospiraceae bacterium]